MRGKRTYTPGKPVTLREQRVRLRADRVDPEAGVIRGVKVLGPSSSNDRVYTQSAMQRAVRLYEGAPVNIDHPSEPDDERSSADRFGKLVNARLADDGSIYADLVYLKSHPMARRIVEAALDPRKHDLFGLSHNARGETEVRDGKVVVTEITEVQSVDLVSNPATTSGLFESRRGRGKTVKILSYLKSLKLTESKRKRLNRHVKRLLEMGALSKHMEMEADSVAPGLDKEPMEAHEEPDGDEMPALKEDDAIKAGLQSAMHAILDDGMKDDTAKIAAIKELLASQSDLVPEGEGEDEEYMPEAEDEEEVHEGEGDDLPDEMKEGEDADLDHMEEGDGEDMSEDDEPVPAPKVKEGKGSCYAKESKSALIAKLKRRDREDAALALCESKGVSPTRTIIKALAGLPGKKDQLALLEQVKTASRPGKARTQTPGGAAPAPAEIESAEQFAKYLLS